MQTASLSKQSTYWLSVVALGLLVGFGIREVRAWTNPTISPPGGNVVAPITADKNYQIKDGGVLLNYGWDTNGDSIIDTANGVGLSVRYGNVGIGTTTPNAKLDVSGKIVSDSTVDTDPGNTVVTKDWVLSKIGASTPPPEFGRNAIDILKDVCGNGSFNVKTVWGGTSDNVTIRCPSSFTPSGSFQVIVDRMTPCEMTRFPYSFSTSNSSVLTETLQSYPVGYGCPSGIVKYPEFRCVGDKSGILGYCEYQEGTGTGDIYYSRNGTWSKTLE